MRHTFQSAFFSANLYQYLPDIPWAVHPEHYETYRRHHHPKALPLHTPGRVSGFDAVSPSGILAAFHLGDHSVLPVSLAAAGIPFDILIDRATFHRYAQELEVADRHFQISGASSHRFFFSNDDRLFFHIKDSLRRGRHVLIFVDGNGGSTDREQGLLPVPFFAGTLRVKTGAAVLARLLGVPIYPFFSKGTASEPVFAAEVPIHANVQADRSADICRIMRQLYQLLEVHLTDRPMQWECWAYLHLNGMLSPLIRQNEQSLGSPHLNAEYLVRLEQDGVEYWLDKKAYLVYRKNDNL